LVSDSSSGGERATSQPRHVLGELKVADVRASRAI
jgi:hypothetical protein